MEHLYAPWRDDYIQDEKQDEKIEGCVFCHIAHHPALDRSHHVLFRAPNYFIVMNKYPYTPGHFMIIPHHHTDALESLDTAVWQEISSHIPKAVALVKEVLGAHGVNLGMNLGSAGGAGIAEHIHFHVVPRWNRDTNFISTVAQTRVYSTEFDAIYEKLLSAAPLYFSEKDAR